MTPEKLKLLMNGIASITDAVDYDFDDLIDVLEDADVIDAKQADAIREGW